MNAISFRRAASSDAAALGAVHVASWHETYAGLVPSDLLNDLSIEGRSAMWGAVLDDTVPDKGVAVFVAESGGQIVGFGACGDQRDASLQARGVDAEVGALYVLRSHQRADVGRSLMSLMAQHLLDRGRAAASLWVLRENAAARTFYEKLGGVLAGERTEEQADARLTEMAYRWDDLSRLIR